MSQENFGSTGYRDLNGKCTARSFWISLELFWGNPNKNPILFRPVHFPLTLTGYSGITRGYVDFGNVFVSRFRVDRVCLVGVQKGRCKSLTMMFFSQISRSLCISTNQEVATDLSWPVNKSCFFLGLRYVFIIFCITISTVPHHRA